MRFVSYAMLVVAWFGALYIATSHTPMERKVDCSLAEFHPDFTPEVRKACRERRSQKL